MKLASLAGTLGLGKLIYLYDDNLISLDGPTELSYTEDVTERFEAYHWHVQMVEDGNDLEGISRAIEAAQAVKDKPSLIRVRTIIGYGSPKAGTNKAPGEPLGEEATKATKRYLNWPEDKSFYVPDEAGRNWLEAVDKGQRSTSRSGTPSSREYRKEYGGVSDGVCERVQSGTLAENWETHLPVFPADSKPIATRNAGGTVMDAIAQAGAGANRRRCRSDQLRPRPS